LQAKQRVVPAVKTLFVHQNFPGQFRHVAAALAADKANQTVALCINEPKLKLEGLTTARYVVKRKPVAGISPYAVDFESKVLRAEACAHAAMELKRRGFSPDVMVVHPGWGEHMFLKDIWPDTKLLMFMEFFYNTTGYDSHFDPEFPAQASIANASLRSKNANLLTALDIMDWAYVPTQWQKSALPDVYHPRTSVIFDGINTNYITPDVQAVFTLPDGRSVKVGDEVLTFINRNLEPYRGFHVFMRALPAIQKARPEAITLIVGGNDVSYGSRPHAGAYGAATSWKEVMLREVGDQLDMSRIVFLGKIPYDQYRQLLRVSRAHVYLTYPFVLSWSMLESMAAECLVIGSTTPPVLEVLEPGRTGLGVDFFDVEGWVKTVTKALARPDDYRDLRTAAREHIVGNYDLRAVCLPAQMALLLRLVEGRVPAG
jgi:glycosyltransferase involved in cell wall biosynthesis